MDLGSLHTVNNMRFSVKKVNSNLLASTLFLKENIKQYIAVPRDLHIIQAEFFKKTHLM